MGIPRDLALKLAAQTVLGAGRMIMETGMHPAVLKDEVTTPSGSTASGLHSLEKDGNYDLFIYGVQKSSSKEEFILIQLNYLP